MSLVASLVTAILRTNGEALVLHVGEKPYVVTAAGNVEMSTRELTYETVAPMLEQLIPASSRSQLEEFGAVEDHLETPLAPDGERFTVVAARGGEDIWIELRRHRQVPTVHESESVNMTSDAAIAEAQPNEPPLSDALPAERSEVPGQTRPTDRGEPQTPDVAADRITIEVAVDGAASSESMSSETVDLTADTDTAPLREIAARPTLVPPPSRAASPTDDDDDDEGAKTAPSGVVLPMRRPGTLDRQSDRSARAGDESSELERLLGLAAARKASALYVVSGSKPSVRVDGEIRPIDTAATLTTEDVEALVLAMMPDGPDDVRLGSEAEWVRDLPDVGRVRCTRFRDHRGPGAIFQLIGARVMSADELGLPRALRDLADEHEGLVLITGPRGSGKSTLFAALVDLVNRTRSAHIITLESQIKVVHESRQSIVSQREVRGDPDAVLAIARTALREGPDVLAIEDLRARDIVALAIQAAESGRLVLGTVPAPSAVAAIERVVDQVADDRRTSVLRAVAGTLRGVAAQVLLRKTGGGRIAAREVLLNTHSVASLIAEGNLAQIPRAMEHGRRAGMTTLNESLVELVRDKLVDARDAYRHSPDREPLLKLLERDGIDTSFVEKMG